MKLYFDSLTTLKVIHAESPIVIFFGTYGTRTKPIIVIKASEYENFAAFYDSQLC